MAHVKRTKTKLVKEVPAYQLTLTEGEADFLAAILGRIAGNPSRSPRKYARGILFALRDVGLDYETADAWPLLDGGMRFRDYQSPSRRYA